MLNLWSDSARRLRENAGCAAGYVACSALVTACYRIADSSVAGLVGEGAPPLWLGLFRLGSLLWLAAGASLCSSAFFSLIGRQVDRPLWRCSGWQDGVRRFFLPWFILNLGQVMLIDLMIKLNDAGLQDALPLLFMLSMASQILSVPVGVCVMYWGRLEWGQFPALLEPIYGNFLLVIPVLLVGFGQWILIDLRAAIIPPDTGLDVLWLGLYDMVLDYITCFAVVMMWRVCMIHRDRSMEGGGNPFDF